MSAAVIRRTRQALGLTVEGFASAVRVSSGRTVRKWEAEERQPPGSVLMLCEYWTDDRCPEWIKPMPAAGHKIKA